MTVVWQKHSRGVLHQVRSAGNSLRLYTDGVFHSQFNPEQPVGGHIWDLLLVPVFFRKNPARRILVLGSGGGAVMRQLNHFLPEAHITGVDINPLHIHVARRYFGVRGRTYTLIEADAIQWIKDYQGEPFDYIVEDLYGEDDGEPVRAVKATQVWFRVLCRHLTPDGVLAMNYLGPRELKACSWMQSVRTREFSPYGERFYIPQYDNIIAVFSPEKLSRKVFRENLQQFKNLDQRRKSTRLKYCIRKMVPKC